MKKRLNLNFQKLNFYYKFPVISLIIFMFFLSFFIFYLFKGKELEKNIYFKQKQKNILRKNINMRLQVLRELKHDVIVFENKYKKLKIYSPNKVTKVLSSYKDILILNYKYKPLKRKSLFKVIKGKVTFLANYKNLNDYLNYLERHGFYLLDIILRRYRYNQKNISLICELKFAFLESKNSLKGKKW